MVDDAYIHRRIAQHYVLTGFAWYNTTEKVMGTSSPIWTILLAIVYRIFGDHAIVVPVVEAIIVGSAATLAGLLSLRLSQQQSAGSSTVRFFCALLITWACLLETAVSQMETPLAVAFLLAGTLLLTGEDLPGRTNGRVHAGLGMMTFAMFTRLELGLFLLLTTLYLWLWKKLRIGTLVYAGVVAIAGALWQLHQFGTLIPNTVGAKAKAYQHVPIKETLSVFGLSWWTLPIFLAFLCVLLWMVYRKKSLDKSPFAAILLLTGGLGLGASYVLHDVLVFPWYVPLVLAPFLLGILLILPDNGKNIGALALVLILWGLHIPFSFGRHVATEALLGHRVKDGLKDAQAARVHEYLKIGSLLNDACPNGTLLTSEIGGLGYTFHGRILDGVGLVTPAAVAFHPLHFPHDSPSQNGGAIPPLYARAVMADLIVTYQAMGEVIIERGPALGYVDYIVPPFLAEDYVPAGYYLGSMHILVRRRGACSLQVVKDILHKSLGTFN